MPAPLDAILKQINDVLKQYENYSPRTDEYGVDHSKAGTAEAITRLKGAIDRLAVAPSPYRESADALLKHYGVTNSYSVKFLVGILKALRADYVAGYLHTVESLIHADLFADFLEMADHLLITEL